MKTNKFQRLTLVIAIFMLVAALLCGCGASSDGYSANYDSEKEYIGDGAPTGELADLTSYEQRKLIRTVNISAETKDFEGFLEAFENAVNSCGGYIQSQNIENSDYDNLRYGSITARIPSDKLDSFVGNVSKSANILSRSSELEDITDQYVDVESRIKALETEQEALLSMLEKASNINEIMSIQSRLTEVRGELESYKARQKQYDNKVAYSTVYISFSEVERENKNDIGFWKEAVNTLSDSFKGAGKMLRGITLFAIAAFPYLLILSILPAIILIIVLIVVKTRRKKKNKQNK